MSKLTCSESLNWWFWTNKKPICGVNEVQKQTILLCTWIFIQHGHINLLYRLFCWANNINNNCDTWCFAKNRIKKFEAKIQQWRKQVVYIFFLSAYSPELNLIEILRCRIKYQWLIFDAYHYFQNLKERLVDVIQNIGLKYDIRV